MPVQVSVLFCCMGNICRSTMAEGVFGHLSAQSPYEGLVGEIDSCGTLSYHSGDGPDSRTMDTLRRNGITDYDHQARKVRASDFDDFDYIFAMDQENLSHLKRMSKTGSRAKVMLFGEYSGRPGKAEIIDDPYYGGQNGFEKAYEQATRFSKNFLDELRANAGTAVADGEK